MGSADLSEIVWYSWFDKFASCGSGRVGSRRGSLSLKGRPSSIGSVGCGGAVGGGGARWGAGGVKALFFIGGSPRFLVDSLLLSMMSKVSGRKQSEQMYECEEYRNGLALYLRSEIGSTRKARHGVSWRLRLPLLG